MATLRKRNGKWQVQVRHTGRTAASRTFTLREDALRWARAQEHDLEVAELPRRREPEKRTLRQLLERYSTEVIPRKRADSSEDFMIRVICRFNFVDLPLSRLRSSHIAEFRDHRLGEAKPATVTRQMRVLLHALRVAADEWGWNVPHAELSKVKLPSVPVVPIDRVTEAEFQKLMAEAHDQSFGALAIALELAISTGMRRSEIVRLTWQDVQLSERRLLIRTSKNGLPRVIPLSYRACELLSRIESTEGAVVGISTNALRLAFGRARRAAGTRFRFHDLRHEAISRLFEAGLTVPEAQLVSGHKTLSQLSRYAHPDLDRIADKLRTPQ